ncbi:hypothetical protein P3H15_31320 [Rhodococcus sp. T2V]|uniref:hypothetical protein n=1 Tax=Rhodococcus sp. T2V TaxID=3034164 RepID=UPI0023E14F40|nr:hypothetical protein [Rhodococcus sp. T2V]MDF3309511.1 hypothetical protein [Rhodococcus sp. T2V]
MTRRIAALATLTAAMCLTASCSILTPEPVTLETNTGPTFTGPPGSGKSPEQQAGEATLVKVNEYYTVLARLSADPAANPADLDTVAAGNFLQSTKRDITAHRIEANAGEVKVLKNTITRHNIPIDENGVPTPGTATIEMDVCLARATDVLELGKPILTNTAWPDPAGWRVTADYTLPGTPCNAGLF